MPASLRKRFTKASNARKFSEGLLIGVLVAAMAGAIYLSKALETMEAKTWDMRVASFAKPSVASPAIKLLFLDQASLDWAKLENGQGWPWPREYYALIVRFLNRTQPKAVVFDVLFSEPSTFGVADDDLLGTEALSSGRLVSGFFLKPAAGDNAAATPWLEGLKPPTFELQGMTELARVSHADLASFPIPEVALSAAMLADTQGSPDADGIYRRAGLFTVYQHRAVPSMGMAAWLVGTGRTQLSYRPGEFDLGESVPVDDQARLLIRYRGPSQTHSAVDVKDIIRSELQIEDNQVPLIDPGSYRDCYVLFGFTAPALFDLRPSPLAANYPGVEVNATVLDNLLAGDFLRNVPQPVSLVYILLISVAAGVLIRFSHKVWQTFSVFVAFILLPIGAGWLLYQPGWWLPVVVPELAALFALIAGFVANYAQEGRQGKFIKGAFSQYLSPIVIDRLIENPELLNLGGEKRELSILFSDIRGFTSISEKLDPVELTALLNEYLSEMTTIIYEYGGTIDKYEGDAIIAFWNAPLDLPDHGLKAVQASLEYQRRLAEIRPRLKEMSRGAEVYTRVGINSGPVVIGNMGSEQRFNYTFFGDAGNLASRLEGMNKQFGTYLMISGHTKDLAGEHPDIAYREISRVAVVGKSEPVTVFEPMSRVEATAKSAVLASFAQGLALYYQGKFHESLAIMEGIAELDPPAAHYIPKLKELIKEAPPDWKGVWVSTEK